MALRLSCAAMGFMGTTKFIKLGARPKGRTAYFRKFKPAHAQWDLMKQMLNTLVKSQRMETTLHKAKELQQYAEEVVFLAKKNTDYHDGLVESMLTSPEARTILYERMVPRYQDRNFHFTRIVNPFKYRERDTAKLGILEYVDRPGELRPANPVGAARSQHIAQEFLSTRRGRRRHLSEVQRILALESPPLDQGILDQCRFELSKFEATSVASASIATE